MTLYKQEYGGYYIYTFCQRSTHSKRNGENCVHDYNDIICLNVYIYIDVYTSRVNERFNIQSLVDNNTPSHFFFSR